MSAVIESLNKAAQEVNIFLGLTFFVVGVFGNIMCILIFSSILKLHMFPASPARLYLLVTAIANFVFVCYLLLTRILMSGFFIPVTNTITFMCKSRFYIGQVCMYTSLFSTCFATIDQYLISSRSAKIRQLSQMFFAKMLLLISFCLWCSINIPILFLYNLNPRGNTSSTVCMANSPIWSFYYTYIQSLLFLCIVPLSIFIIFGILTRKNLQTVQQNRRSVSNQISRMVFLQATAMALSLLVATVQIIYQQVTMNIQKDALRNAQDNMFNTMANLLTYVTYFADFYIYVGSSKNLRRSLHNLVFRRSPNLTTNTNAISTHNQQTITVYHNQVQPTEEKKTIIKTENF